jgi:drug/metabolite transporter (DMT)-like permease
MGMLTMVLGEVANFAAYSYAPAILVTPLGAGSVFLSAVLASIFLGERLGVQGTIGCALCLIGSLVIILHSPEEKKIDSVTEILNYAVKPAFLLYMTLVTAISLYLIYQVGPKYGRENLLVYITICSLVGSISVMAVKGFGIAVKLTLAGNNQFFSASTYVFLIVVVVCAVTQMNYFNKALDLFSTNRVTPIYYVFFTTATIIASVILFQGFNDTSALEVTTIFCGFLTIFIGVFELNSTRDSEHTHLHQSGHELNDLEVNSFELEDDDLHFDDGVSSNHRHSRYSDM